MSEGGGRKWSPSNAKLWWFRSGGALVFWGVFWGCFGGAVWGPSGRGDPNLRGHKIRILGVIRSGRKIGVYRVDRSGSKDRGLSGR